MSEENQKMNNLNVTSKDNITLKLTADTDVPVGSLLSCAVPYPKGRVADADVLAIRNEKGRLLLNQCRVLSRWLDGSVEWAKICWLADESSAYRVDVATSAEIQTSPVSNHIASDHCDISAERLKETPFDLAGVKLDFCVEVEGEGKLQTTVDSVQKKDHGPIQTEFDVRGRLIKPSGETCLDWFATMSVVHATGLQRWSFTIRNSHKANHAGGIWELGDTNSILIHSATVTGKPSRAGEQERNRLHYRLHEDQAWQTSSSNWKLCQLGSGGNNYQHPNHRDRSDRVRVPIQGYQLNNDGESEEGDRAQPSVVLETESGECLGVVVPKFWQNFPRVLSWQSNAIELGLFPAEFGTAHELQPGEQKTAEFAFALGNKDNVTQEIDSFSNIPAVRVDPQWICRTGVIPWLTTRKDQQSDGYLPLVDQVVVGDHTFFHKRELIDQYGWRNFGDVFGDHEAVNCSPEALLVSHYNNQYDMLFGLGLNYLRGGDPKYGELMFDLARHVIDIDIYHTDDDLPCYNHGMFWHTVHYIDAGLAGHRTYPRGSCGGGPSSGHAYSRGLLLYYQLTGDETAREAVIKMGQWMIASEDGSKTKYRWLAGGETGLTTASGTETYHGPGRGPGNAVEVLMSAFQLSHERGFLEHAEHLIRRITHPEQDIESLDLLDAENKWFYLMFLQALGRYLEVKISMDEIDEMYAYAQVTLLKFADWMADHEYPYLDHPEKLEFPTETWAAQEMRKTEVFQWAARHGGASQRQRYLERANYFYRTSIDQLNRSPTKSFCRPVALLLSNGYSHDFFKNGGLGLIPEAPVISDPSLPPQQNFLSQKTRAIRNCKLLLGFGALVIFLVTLFAVVTSIES